MLTEKDPDLPLCPDCGARHYPAIRVTGDGVYHRQWCDGTPASWGKSAPAVPVRDWGDAPDYLPEDL